MFLKSDCTHLFMVDSDTIPPKDAIDRLLALKCPVATGLTPMVRFDKEARNKDIRMNYSTVYNAAEIDKNGTTRNLRADTGIREVWGAGGSCLLISREVAEKTPRPLFRNVYEDDNGKQEFMSEDVYFITKARQAGFKSYADTGLICWHSKTIIF